MYREGHFTRYALCSSPRDILQFRQNVENYIEDWFDADEDAAFESWGDEDVLEGLWEGFSYDLKEATKEEAEQMDYDTVDDLSLAESLFKDHAKHIWSKCLFDKVAEEVAEEEGPVVMYEEGLELVDIFPSGKEAADFLRQAHYSSWAAKPSWEKIDSEDELPTEELRRKYRSFKQAEPLGEPLGHITLIDQTYAEYLKGHVEVVELEDLTGLVPHVAYGGASKSVYFSPKSHKNVYVLERSGHFAADSYSNDVWFFDVDFTAVQARDFLERWDKKKREEARQNEEQAW